MLRELIKIYGSGSLVFIDESGFEKFQAILYAWSKKGKKIYGEKQGKRGKRENLVAGRRKGKKDFIAPMIFEGSLDASGFEGWLSLFLLPSLTIPSIPEMLNLATKLNISRRSNPKMTKLACKDNPSEPVYITRILTHEAL